MLQINKYSSEILNDITFHLNDGENLIILGANGAGKSTLAKLICGINKSDNIELFGENINSFSAKKRAQNINYISPRLEVFDEYISLKEYLELSLLYGNMTVDEVISELCLKELQDKSCKTLSSGEQQLLLVASAILHNAKITIFDEPTANLDPKKTLEVYEVLKSDKIQNRIIITHDLSLAYKLGYKVLYIKDKTIAFFDTNENFFKKDNLDNFFGSSLKRIDDSFVVNL